MCLDEALFEQAALSETSSICRMLMIVLTWTVKRAVSTMIVVVCTELNRQMCGICTVLRVIYWNSKWDIIIFWCCILIFMSCKPYLLINQWYIELGVDCLSTSQHYNKYPFTLKCQVMEMPPFSWTLFNKLWRVTFTKEDNVKWL